MPWQEDERLDGAALTGLIRRCASTGSHGIYMAGTAGEFHAMDLEQFADAVKVFMREIRRHPGLGHQVGCGAFSLKQVLQRIRIARDHGAGIIQLNLPGWVPLTDDEVVDFFRSVARAFPDQPIVVYDNKASGRTIGADLWPTLLESSPCIVGAKITYAVPELPARLKAIAPGFKFFAVENTFQPMSRSPIDGVTAWISYSFPPIIRELWQARLKSDWTRFDQTFRQVEILHGLKARFREKGYRAGIMDRLMGLASGFLDPVFARTLNPWRNVDRADINHMRQLIRKQLNAAYLQPT